MSKIYLQANDKASLEVNAKFFPSFFAFVNYILEIDKNPTIIFQSFGNEIPLVLEVMKKRFGDKLKVESEIGIFDKNGYLEFKNKLHKDFESIETLIKPFTVMGWQNDYANRNKVGKLLLFKDSSMKTHFYDDHANKYAHVVHIA